MEQQPLREPLVAIAIVSWNTRELLDACLRSMRADVQSGLAEVWVVDNASNDGSAELVRDEHPWARLLALEENVGYGSAANRVAARTRAPWFAPSNADVELTAGALRALVDAAMADSRAGAVGPRLVLPDGSTQPSVQPFPGLATTTRAILGLDRLRGGRHDYDLPSRVPWVTGAFLIVRRDAWNAVGGFDEAQWMYAEDLDLCWRLSRAGWTTRYEPAAAIHHRLSAAAVAAFGSDMDDRWRRATWAWMVRRRGLVRTWLTAGSAMLADALRLAGFSALAHGRPDGRWAARARRARLDLHASRLGLRSRRALLDAR